MSTAYALLVEYGELYLYLQESHNTYSIPIGSTGPRHGCQFNAADIT